jgi:hypothetical protein
LTENLNARRPATSAGLFELSKIIWPLYDGGLATGGLAMRTFLALAAVFLALTLNTSTNHCRGDFVVLPDIPHDRWDVVPFGERSGDGNYQQIYDSSMFDEPVLIQGLAFSLLVVQEFTADISIRLGHTSVDVTNISPILANNITSPLTTVFVDDNYVETVNSGSESFDLKFSFDATPFYYDPTSGEDLILDISISGKRPTGQISEQGVSMIPSVPTGLTSRAYDMVGFQGVDQWGMRTAFTLSVVPEASTIVFWTCISVVTAGLSVVRWRR